MTWKATSNDSKARSIYPWPSPMWSIPTRSMDASSGSWTCSSITKKGAVPFRLTAWRPPVGLFLTPDHRQRCPVGPAVPLQKQIWVDSCTFSDESRFNLSHMDGWLKIWCQGNEHCHDYRVWGGQPVHNLQDLQQALHHGWAEVLQAFSLRLVNSVRRRCTGCVDAVGGYTQRWITKQKTLTDLKNFILTLPLFCFQS